MKKVTILITNYNYGRYLNRCIRSCLNQSMPSTEYDILIVDDKSTDNSCKILNYWQGRENIKVIFNEDNIGLGACCKLGVMSCRSPYIVRVDADDYVAEDFVKFLYMWAHTNKSHAVACDYLEVDLNEQILRRGSSEDDPIGCGILFRTDCLEFIGSYSNNRSNEDKELRSRFDPHFNVEHLNIPMYRYLKHDDSMTYQGSTIDVAIQARLGSSRFPNKVLENINHQHTVLSFLVERLLYIKSLRPYINNIAVLTTKKDYKKIKSALKKYDIEISFGSETNVLKRFDFHFKNQDTFKFFRVTADNPFLCVDSFDLIYNSEFKNYDYTSLYHKRNLPDGQVLSLFQDSFFKKIKLKKYNKKIKEHLIFANEYHEDITLLNPKIPSKYKQPNISWAINRKEDLCSMYNKLKDPKDCIHFDSLLKKSPVYTY